jgi:hypothetical protein
MPRLDPEALLFFAFPVVVDPVPAFRISGAVFLGFMIALEFFTAR